MTSRLRRFLLIGFVTSGGVGCASRVPVPVSSEPAVSKSPGGLGMLNLEHTFLKARGSTDPKQEVFFYFKGEIRLSGAPVGTQPRALGKQGPVLWFDGFNVARFEQRAGKTRMLSREILVYRDKTGAIIDCWRAPWSEQGVRVVHVANDPVNFTLSSWPRIEGKASQSQAASQAADSRQVIVKRTVRRLPGRIEFLAQIDLAYPSPLPVADYPRYSTGDTYRSQEQFRFTVSTREAVQPATTIPAELGWKRIGQPLPWMQGGPDREASLVYQASGRKLTGGWDELPADLRRFVKRRYPAYQHPPASDEAPNQTSWRAFKKQLDDGVYQPSCL